MNMFKINIETRKGIVQSLNQNLKTEIFYYDL